MRSTTQGMKTPACGPINVILTYIASLRPAWSEILSQKQTKANILASPVCFLKGFKHL